MNSRVTADEKLSYFSLLLVYIAMLHICRISDVFDHNELDAINDRKDKFKRYLCTSKLVGCR